MLVKVAKEMRYYRATEFGLCEHT